MTIRIDADTTITNEFGIPMHVDAALDVRATLTNGRYTFTHDSKRYRVNEKDAQITHRDGD